MRVVNEGARGLDYTLNPKPYSSHSENAGLGLGKAILTAIFYYTDFGVIRLGFRV